MVNDINRAERKAHKAVDETRWLARTVFEASRKRMSEHMAELQQQLRSKLARPARSKTTPSPGSNVSAIGP